MEDTADSQERVLLAKLNEAKRAAGDAWQLLRGVRAAERAVSNAGHAAGQEVPPWARTALTGAEASAHAAYEAAVKAEAEAHQEFSDHIDRRIAAAHAEAAMLAAGQVRS